MKKLASTITAALLVAVLAVGLAATGAAEPDEESDVDVTVSSETALDVRPSSLAYSDAEVGELESTSDEGFAAVELENIGSESLDQIFAQSTMPSESPFGQGDENNYNTGNMLTVSTEQAGELDDNDELPANVETSGTDRQFHFLNRVEFEEDPAPSYIQTTDPEVIDGDHDSVDVGRFRTGEEEYFYAIYYDESNGCVATVDDESQLFVGTEAHTPTELGTFDFTLEEEDSGADAASEEVEEYELVQSEGSGDFGTTSSSVALGDDEYSVFTYCDDDDETDDHTIRTRFNVDVESPVTGDNLGEGDAGANRFILDDSDALEPGASFPLDIGVQIPLGTSEGDLDTGTMTIIAANTEE